jgi:predicted DNA-binding transcriptional regulator AlpA
MDQEMLTPEDTVQILRLPSIKALYQYQMLDRHPDQLPKPRRIGRLLRWTRTSVVKWLQD